MPVNGKILALRPNTRFGLLGDEWSALCPLGLAVWERAPRLIEHEYPRASTSGNGEKKRAPPEI
jgi:hypothetical protein